jgi:hypothetical protein
MTVTEKEAVGPVEVNPSNDGKTYFHFGCSVDKIPARIYAIFLFVSYCLFEILIGLKGRIPGRPEVTVFCFCFKKSAVIHKVNTYMDPGRATCRQSIALPTELPIAANHKKNLERLWTNPYG